MKKIIISLMVVFAVSVAAATATYAYFSDTKVLGNTVTAAVLKIRFGSATQPISLTALTPGIWTSEHQVRVYNDPVQGSNIGATIKATAQRTGNLSVYDNLYMIVKNSDGVVLYNGWLRDFSNRTLYGSLLMPDEYKDFTFTFRLNPDVGNEYQAATTAFNLVFTATQQMP